MIFNLYGIHLVNFYVSIFDVSFFLYLGGSQL